MPPPGALVEMVGCEMEICFGSNDIHEVQSFIAGEVDRDAPLPIDGPYWDLHDVNEAWEAGCCGSPPRLAIYLRGEVAPEPATQASRILEVDVAVENEIIDVHRMLLPPSGLDLPVTIESAELGDASVDDLCVRMTLSDLAGNRGERSAWLCRPCHAVVERSHVTSCSLTPEPEWSVTDRVVDGYCGIGDPPGPVEPPGETGDPPDGAETSAVGSSDGIGDTGNDPMNDTSVPFDPAIDTDAAPAEPDQAVDRGCACGTLTRSPGGWAFVLLVLAVRRRLMTAA